MTLQIMIPEYVFPNNISRNCLLCESLLKINQHSFKCKKYIWKGKIQKYSNEGHLTGTCHKYRLKNGIKLI